MAAPDHVDVKLRATLAAQLALAGGFTMHDMADGGFEIARWGRFAYCSDLAAVQSFLDRLGTRHSHAGDTGATP